MDDNKKLSNYVSTMYIHVKEVERKTTSTKMAKKESTKERYSNRGINRGIKRRGSLCVRVPGLTNQKTETTHLICI